jgi:hypothetical protein
MSNNPIWVLTDGIFVGLAFALTIFVFGAVETGPLGSGPINLLAVSSKR